MDLRVIGNLAYTILATAYRTESVKDEVIKLILIYSIVRHALDIFAEKFLFL